MLEEDSKLKIARVCFMREFSSERGDMCNLAYIAVTTLNFWLAWQKIRNCGGRLNYTYHPFRREFYHKIDSS